MRSGEYLALAKRALEISQKECDPMISRNHLSAAVKKGISTPPQLCPSAYYREADCIPDWRRPREL
jgi:hypothetical protein